MPYWRPGIIAILGLPLILLAGCSRGQDTGFVPRESSTGHLEIRESGGPRTYSFRSDPDTEFIRMTFHGGMVMAHHPQTVVFSDGRFVKTRIDRQGNTIEVHETQLSEREMSKLLMLIVDSGLMDHDHRKAKIATFRDPTNGRGARGCIDCATVSITIRLGESNCPGRQPGAPVTATVTATSAHLSRYYGDVPEYLAVDTLSKVLAEYGKRSRVPRQD